MLALPVLCLVPALQLGITAIETVVIALFPILASEAAMFERMTSGGLISVIMACLVAPMVQEMLCRGVILRSFLRQYGRWPAIVGSALLFGVSHMNIYQGVAGSIIGVVLGWLYERTRSLWPCILLHARYNAALMFSSDPDGGPSPAGGLAALMLACAGTLMLRKLLLARST